MRYDSTKARQEGLFRKPFKPGQEVQYPLGTGSMPRVGLGHIVAESIIDPGRWFVQDRSDRVIRGPYWPDQLLET